MAAGRVTTRETRQPWPLATRRRICQRSGNYGMVKLRDRRRACVGLRGGAGPWQPHRERLRGWLGAAVWGSLKAVQQGPVVLHVVQGRFALRLLKGNEYAILTVGEMRWQVARSA
ncbi:alkane 1-monooxygenase [Sesbania bispinosa]|nr:alkane 1-monooxygenase [Sesbania bispinosa]